MTFHRIARLPLIVVTLLGATPTFAQTAPTPQAPPSVRAPAPVYMAPPMRVAPQQRSPAWERPFPSSDATRFIGSRFYSARYQAVQQYARCIAHVAPGRASEFVASAPNSLDETFKARLLISSARGCLPLGFYASKRFLRGGVAEALYKELDPAQQVAPATPALAQQVRSQAVAFRRDVTHTVDNNALIALGNCIATVAPAATRSLLLTTPGSDQELSAINALFATGSGCSNVRQYPADGARTFLRAFVAESAYRLAKPA